ncbi:methyl-accepting chemotaxis protein [Paenibacillus sp. YN15]|uniref:methyl-accepting chemotaxis protein n=1 Tax=Paenibacillus sp. YN15 TaxID=1742774 RepID=UPI0015EC9862|nr:methyl-accepting chemotaxis protein [Paenibacillus sp. YN15]
MKSLHLRIALYFSAFILFAGLILSYVTYTSSKRLVTDSLGQQARTVAEAALKQIDVTKYKDITPEKGETPYYHELRAKLNTIREENGLKYLYTMAARSKDGATEYYYVVDGAPADAEGEDFSPLGQVEEEQFPEFSVIFENKELLIGELVQADSYGATISAYVPILDANQEMLGILGADFDASEVYRLLDENRSRIIWVTGSMILLSFAVIYAFARVIFIPLRRMTAEMQRVQNGDLTVEMTVRGKDEVARLAAGFSQMVKDLRRMISAIKTSTELLHQSAGMLVDNMGHTEKVGQQITQDAGDASVHAQGQWNASRETARAMGEVGAGVNRVAESASVVAEASQAAASAVRDGDASVHLAVDQMEIIGRFSQAAAADIRRLEERSREVEQIAGTIRDIAAQTNLLALNAAIEAARAGEAGRGFAVVADQVRKLSVQSEASTAAITELIRNIQIDTGRAVQAAEKEYAEVRKGLEEINAVGGQFHHILSQVDKVASEVQEVSAVSQQIAAAAEEVTASVEEVARMSQLASGLIDGIASASREQSVMVANTRQSSEELIRMAVQLDALVERFNV